MFRKSIILIFLTSLTINIYLIVLFQIDVENYDIRLIELDSCGESERTVFIMPPEMTDLPSDSLYSYNVLHAKFKIIFYYYY